MRRAALEALELPNDLTNTSRKRIEGLTRGVQCLVCRQDRAVVLLRKSLKRLDKRARAVGSLEDGRPQRFEGGAQLSPVLCALWTVRASLGADPLEVLGEFLPSHLESCHGIRNSFDRAAQPVEVRAKEAQETILLPTVQPNDRGQVRELLRGES